MELSCTTTQKDDYTWLSRQLANMHMVSASGNFKERIPCGTHIVKTGGTVDCIRRLFGLTC
jgi:hypothetical protein